MLPNLTDAEFRAKYTMTIDQIESLRLRLNIVLGIDRNGTLENAISYLERNAGLNVIKLRPKLNR